MTDDNTYTVPIRKRPEIVLNDDDLVTAGSIGGSGESVRLLFEFMFVFGRPTDETLERLRDHLDRYPMESAKAFLKRKGRL